MKKALCIILAAIMLLGCTACGSDKTPAASAASAPAASAAAGSTSAVTRTKMQVGIGCGTSSGVGYATASTIGAILQNLYPDYYTSKPEVTTGGAESIRLLANGDVALCSAMADDALAAYDGERDFQGTQGKLRYITSGNMTTVQCFAQDELNVSSLTDCKGLRMAVTSGTMYNYYWDYFCKAYGMTNADFKSVNSYSTKDAVSAFRDGQVDVICMVTAVPNSTIQDLAMSDGVKLLTMTPEEQDKVISIQPCFEKTTVDCSNYSGSGEINTVGVRNVYVCLDTTDYQLVYDWVKAIDENNAALTAAHPQAGQYGDHANVLNCQKIPFAQAAEDYYTEVGLIKK